MATPTSNSVNVTSVDPSDAGSIAQYLVYGTKWDDGGSAAVTLTYSFLETGSATFINNYGLSSESESYTGLDSASQAATRKALAAWSAVSGLTFTEVDDNSSEVGELRFGLSDNLDSDSAAHAYLPGSYVEAGDVWINPEYWNTDGGSVGTGSYDFNVLLHEIGHALGLKHPFESPAIPAAYDSYKYTVMSYTAWTGSEDNYASFYPTTPMYYDIVAMQALYGVKTTYKTGNDTYTFSQGTQYFQTIYDAGGSDTIVFDGTRACSINLNDGAFSSLSDVIYFNNGLSSTMTVCIGPNTIIENATGGSGADTLTGNGAANILNGGLGADKMYGGGGNDTYYVNTSGDIISDAGGVDNVRSTVSWTLGANIENLTLITSLAANATGNDLANIIVGGAGANTLIGGAGADTMSGKAGNDIYYAGFNDTLIEDASAGTDTVNVAMDWVLGDNFENLNLTGSSAISGTGNGLANVIKGNGAANTIAGAAGNDTIYGGGAADTLTGGTGVDAYVFNTALGGGNVDTITDFSVVADTIWLENAVFTRLTVTGTLSADAFRIGSAAADSTDRIIYNSVTGALIYDYNGNASGGGLHFATVAVGLALTNNDFLVV